MNREPPSRSGPPVSGPPDDVALLAAIGAGQQDAFATFMARHGPMALRLALRMTPTRQDAEDTVQDAFLRVWRHAGAWSPNGGARVTTWFYRIVMNLCLDRRRRAPMAALEDIAEPEDPSPGGLEHYSGAQARFLVREALDALPERQRAAVALCYFEEVSGQDAAKALNVSVSALESLLVRGRRSLRAFFVRRGLDTSGDLL